MRLAWQLRLSLRLRDRVLAERVEPADDAETPWSNLGDDELRPAHAVYDAAAGTVTYPGGVVGSTAESAAEDELATAVANCEDGEPEVLEAELIDVVVEVVTLPPGQKRIPASQVIDSDGVPYGRGGYARRLQRKVPGNGRVHSPNIPTRCS